jgi:DMSO/TMAO reductase YedYZ molybdopterin-dependent catalytic subunit
MSGWRRDSAVAALLAASLAAGLAGGVEALWAQTESVEVTGAVPAPRPLAIADLRALPRTSVVVSERDGSPATYEGVELVEVLRAAGLDLGAALRGPVLGYVLVVEAADGYRAPFSLGEVDPELTGRTVLLADLRNGAPLEGDLGPLRLVVPDDRRPARWVRQVTAVRVVGAL